MKISGPAMLTNSKRVIDKEFYFVWVRITVERVILLLRAY